MCNERVIDMETTSTQQGPVDVVVGQSGEKSFSRRVWLNPEGHASTGSVVVFDGPTTWLDNQGNTETMRIVEIADCHGKVRLHQAKTDTLEQFEMKVRTLRDVLSDFLDHLDNVLNARDNPSA